MVIKHNQDLKSVNTFGISANAAKYAVVQSEADLLLLIKTGIRPVYILGGGSNLLLTGSLEGLVIKNEIKGIRQVAATESEVVLAVGGGENWHELVCWTLKENLGGIENLSLIPGSVGAAPIQNIGAYGVELKDVFHQLEAIHLETGQTKIFSKEDCAFGYRDSCFKNELKGQYFITKVILRLSKDPQPNISYGAIETVLAEKGIIHPTIQDVSNAVIEIRKKKLPDPAVIGNSGSFFKNPLIDAADFERLQKLYPDIVFYKQTNGAYKIPAGWLIEKAGWKGKRVGAVGCHEKQALVLVNYGGGTGIDIRNLANQIQVDILNRFGIGLTPEVNFW